LRLLSDALEFLDEENRSWIFDEPENPRWPFTFQNCCDFLGIDAGYLRRVIKRI
jgi:hypothetical protein